MTAQRQASSASQTPHLSPAELSYLYTSLALPNTPIRPDGRSPTQFRPLTAETDILPGTNGSARIGFADGTQAIVGVKAEVERTVVGANAFDLRGFSQQAQRSGANVQEASGNEGSAGAGAGAGGQGDDGSGAAGQGSWVQMSIEIPGFRDDDALPVFLAEMMREPLVGSVADYGGSGSYGEGEMVGGLKGRLVINKRWHWRLYIDVLLLSQPLSYPLPLLSLTTHLALLSTKLPKLKSQGEEDPFFDDDWAAAEHLYPHSRLDNNNTTTTKSHPVRPPITLLVISVGENIIFDPSREEIAVADTILAVSITRNTNPSSSISNGHEGLKLLSIRTIDPPSRLTQPGVADAENVATQGSTAAAEEASLQKPATVGDDETPGVWRPRRGGVKRGIVARIVKVVLKRGGVGEEVLEGLEGVEVG